MGAAWLRVDHLCSGSPGALGGPIEAASIDDHDFAGRDGTASVLHRARNLLRFVSGGDHHRDPH